MRASPSIAPFAATLLLAVTPEVGATEIYKWVDAEGVTHFSQVPPPDDVPELGTIQIDTTNPEDWDPEDYDHSILNQARRTDERLAAAEEVEREENEQLAGAEASWPPPYYYPPDRYAYYPPIVSRPRHRYGHGSRPPGRMKHKKPRRRPAHRFDYGDRFAHPARSHRRLGAGKRYGYLGHRVTHRQRRAAFREE